MEGQKPAGDGVVQAWRHINVVVWSMCSVRIHRFRRLAVADPRAEDCKSGTWAIQNGCAVIVINEFPVRAVFRSASTALPVMPKVFQRHIEASGVIPQISVIMGLAPGAGSGLLSPAMTIFLHGQRYLFTFL